MFCHIIIWPSPSCICPASLLMQANKKFHSSFFYSLVLVCLYFYLSLDYTSVSLNVLAYDGHIYSHRENGEKERKTVLGRTLQIERYACSPKPFVCLIYYLITLTSVSKVFGCLYWDKVYYILFGLLLF